MQITLVQPRSSSAVNVARRMRQHCRSFSVDFQRSGETENDDRRTNPATYPRVSARRARYI